MDRDYLFRKQVIEIFDLDENFLIELEREELIETVPAESGQEKVFPADQIERLRIITNLTRDLEVNLAGVEVILEMRENMIRMQRQFDRILGILVDELKGRMT